jgi:hypothetical protein
MTALESSSATMTRHTSPTRGCSKNQWKSNDGRCGSTWSPGSAPSEMAHSTNPPATTMSKSVISTIVDASVVYVAPSTRCFAM